MAIGWLSQHINIIKINIIEIEKELREILKRKPSRQFSSQCNTIRCYSYPHDLRRRPETFSPQSLALYLDYHLANWEKHLFELFPWAPEWGASQKAKAATSAVDGSAFLRALSTKSMKTWPTP